MRLLPSATHGTSEAAARNQEVWAISQTEPIYRNAWRDDAQYALLRAELAPLDNLPRAAPPATPAAAAPPPPRGKAGYLALFDAAYYLDRYPELRPAIGPAGFPDARTHYDRAGFNEGRDAFAFNEDWYAATYPEVVPEIAQGNFASCRHHYAAIGHLIGCLPGPPASAPTDADLFARFVSLGDNCEFGLVQRAAGLEPLDLLRFGGTGLNERGLVVAMEERFAAFGTHEDLVVRNDGGEWVSTSRRYDFVFHTQRPPASVEHAVIVAEERQRLHFLARKLVRDLEASDKIFVRKSNKPVAEDLLYALYRAMRGYGGPTLLWVCLADAAHPAGTLESLAPGFLRGYIRRFAPYEDATAISVEDWRQVCAAALQAAGPTLARPSRPDAEQPA